MIGSLRPKLRRQHTVPESNLELRTLQFREWTPHQRPKCVAEDVERGAQGGYFDADSEVRCNTVGQGGEDRGRETSAETGVCQNSAYV